MEAKSVGKISDFEELKPKIVKIDGLELAVCRLGDDFYCYIDRCPHQGGPAGEGEVRGAVKCEVRQDGTHKEYTSKVEFSIACPWHGIEYDLKTGICRTLTRFRLRTYETLVVGDELRVKV